MMNIAHFSSWRGRPSFLQQWINHARVRHHVSVWVDDRWEAKAWSCRRSRPRSLGLPRTSGKTLGSECFFVTRQLSKKINIWSYNWSLVFDKVVRFHHAPVTGLHDVSNGKSGRSGNSGMAVQKDFLSFQSGFLC